MKNKNIFLGIALVLVMLFVTGCVFYNLLDAAEFKNHFSALGYTISDTETADYEADKYLVAYKEDVPYKIEYYEFDTDINAKKVYEKYKKNIANYITSNSENKETTGAIMGKIVAVSEKEYIIISRVKNTLIFINGTNEYADEINKILDEIEY